MASAADPGVALARAHASFQALHGTRRYDAARNLYGRPRALRGRAYETLWPFATAWSAVATLATVTGEERAAAIAGGLADGVAAYGGSDDSEGPLGLQSAVVPPLGRGGDVYYDDNAWVGLALVAGADLPSAGGTARADQILQRARRVLAFVCGGWSDREDWAYPGGIRWKVSPSSRGRNTCANAPTAELAALVHARTGDADALAWATRLYAWTRAALRQRDGLYADRITPDGTVEPTRWSYNQGTMIGAGVLLHALTGEHRYLDDARNTAQACAERFTTEVLLRQDAAFDAVYARNLLLLDARAPEAWRQRQLQAYSDAMWERRRGRHGLFTGGRSSFHDTAAMLQVDALLAGARPTP